MTACDRRNANTLTLNKQVFCDNAQYLLSLSFFFLLGVMLLSDDLPRLTGEFDLERCRFLEPPELSPLSLSLRGESKMSEN